MMTSQVLTNQLGWNAYNKHDGKAKLNLNTASITGNKRQRVTALQDSYPKWNMNMNMGMFVEGDENKHLNSNLQPNYFNPVKKHKPLFDGTEYKKIKQAAVSLLNLSFATGLYEPFPRKGLDGKINNVQLLKKAPITRKVEKFSGPVSAVRPEEGSKVEKGKKIEKPSTKGEEEPDENNPLDNELYRRKAQELLFQHSDILLGERKDAFFELVKRLCPYINIVRSGSRTLRTYLVDTRKKKRYRTYSDAIKGGALDPLLIQTGTTVLLRGCVEEAQKRFGLLSKEDQMYIHKATA